MIKRLGFAEQCVVRIMCALAVLLVGFAHKPPVLDNSQIPLSEITQYVLPDGSLPVLCLPSEDGKAKHNHHDTGSGCEACRLAASVLLPTLADEPGLPILREAERAAPIRTEAFSRQLFPPNASPRGPPFGLTV